MMTVTVMIVAITVITSLIAFNNERAMDALIFYPPDVTERKQYYRFLTCGFIHADIPHLLFNMISLYLFSNALVEPGFTAYFFPYGKTALVIMYLLAIVISIIPTYLKNRHNSRYKSLGASGAVSAVVFAGIIISPLSQLGFFIIPPVIPGFIFGPLYLILSAYLDKRAADNINHSAHIFGALFGVAFIIIGARLWSHVDLWQHLVDEVQFYFKSKFG
jgi:membrane associated rhomboid family serine protease